MSVPALDPIEMKHQEEMPRRHSSDIPDYGSTRKYQNGGRRRRWTWVGVMVLIAAAIAALISLSRESEETEVFVAPAKYEDMQRLVTTNGVVVPTDEFQARAFWPGIITKVYVELGDKVKPGQLLVSMKDPFALERLASANSALQSAELGEQNIQNGGSQEERIGMKGDLESAEIADAQASKALAALKQLQRQGAASEAEVNAAAAKLKADDAVLATLKQKNTDRYSPGDVKGAKARVADAEATLQAAKVQFGNANITTPIAGTVYSIKVVDYDWVPVGTDLIRVANLNNVEIRAYFDEPEIGKLKAGQPVTIVWDGRPGRVWHGHIKQAPIAATALGPRSVGECMIAVDDAKEDLLPNTNVIVTVTLQHQDHALSIPRTALREDGLSYYVYRVIDDHLQRTPVDVGIINLDRAEITKGLSQNDEVALNTLNNEQMRDGLAVKVARH